MLDLPATNAVCERSFAALKRVNRLNHLMVLHIHKDKTESLNIPKIQMHLLREKRQRTKCLYSSKRTNQTFLKFNIKQQILVSILM